MFVCAQTLWAQNNPKHGFIITNNNDTIFGTLDFRTNKINSQECNFIPKGSKELKKYYPGDIYGYRFMENGKFYISKEFNYKGNRIFCFAEYMLKGMLDLYRIPYKNTSNYLFFIVRQDGKTIAYEKDNINATIDKQEAIIKGKELYAELAPSPHAIAEFEMGKLNEKRMIKMLRGYHEDLCTSSEECIEFEYDPKSDENPKHFMAYIGATTLYCNEEGEHTSKMTSPLIGIGLDIMLPRINKRLSWQIMGEWAICYKYKNQVEIINDYYKMVQNVKDNFYKLSLKTGPKFCFGKKDGTKLNIAFGLIPLIYKNEEDECTSKLITITPNFYGSIGIEYPTKSMGDIFVNTEYEYTVKMFAYGCNNLTIKAGVKF